MFRKMLRSKIHRATVTAADLNYEGSITIPPELLKASEIAPFEAVHIWDITRGTRFETYAISGEEGSNDICVNGAAAHLVDPGDLIIIAAFNYLASDEISECQPRVVFVDQHNRIRETRPEIPGPRQ